MHSLKSHIDDDLYSGFYMRVTQSYYLHLLIDNIFMTVSVIFPQLNCCTLTHHDVNCVNGPGGNEVTF